MSNKERKNVVLEQCLGRPLELAGAIDYGSDSVVSKTLIDKEAGTVTLFAFDAGQGLSEHQAPYDAIVQIIEGKGDIVIDGKDIDAAAGQLIVMPANVPHAVKANERFKMLLTMIRQKA